MFHISYLAVAATELISDATEVSTFKAGSAKVITAN